MLAYEPFDYTDATTFIGTPLNAVGFNQGANPTDTYQDLVGGGGSTAGSNTIVSGSLSGSLLSSGNSLQIQSSTRGREIIDRTTAAWVASGIVAGDGNLGADGSTLYGSGVDAGR